MSYSTHSLLRFWHLAVVLGCGLALSACTSVQWIDRDGRVRAAGWVTSQALESEEPVTRIAAPALSLRLLPGMVGYSIGWRETTLFQGHTADGSLETVAIADRTYGIAIDVGRLIIGAERRFGVFMPDPERSVIQRIEYSESADFPTTMHRQEVQ